MRAVLTQAALVLALTAAAAEAHEAGELPLRSSWPWHPWLLAGLCAAGILYGLGVSRLRRRPAGRKAVGLGAVAAYGAGLASLFIALVSPLDKWSERLFSAHMAQHELLMVVAAPLMVLGRPLVPMLWALPAVWRRRVGLWVRRPSARAAWRWLTGPIVVWLLHGTALWILHLPSLFEAALADQLFHAFQHTCFFWTAALFWWAVTHGRYGRSGYGLSILFVFTTGLHSGALGALLAWSSTVWYHSYARLPPAWGALEDQQLAGLIMWVPAGLTFIIVGLALFAAWVGESETRVGHGRAGALIASAGADGVGPSEY
jgi:putative membrane protein